MKVKLFWLHHISQSVSKLGEQGLITFKVLGISTENLTKIRVFFLIIVKYFKNPFFTAYLAWNFHLTASYQKKDCKIIFH